MNTLSYIHNQGVIPLSEIEKRIAIRLREIEGITNSINNKDILRAYRGSTLYATLALNSWCVGMNTNK